MNWDVYGACSCELHSLRGVLPLREQLTHSIAYTPPLILLTGRDGQSAPRIREEERARTTGTVACGIGVSDTAAGVIVACELCQWVQIA